MSSKKSEKNEAVLFIRWSKEDHERLHKVARSFKESLNLHTIGVLREYLDRFDKDAKNKDSE